MPAFGSVPWLTWTTTYCSGLARLAATTELSSCRRPGRSVSFSLGKVGQAQGWGSERHLVRFVSSLRVGIVAGSEGCRRLQKFL